MSDGHPGKHVDPEVAEYLANREGRKADLETKLRLLEEPVLADLRAVGVNVESVDDLVNIRRIAPAAVDVMMSWLPRLDDHRLQCMVIRALTAAGKPYDAQPLIRLFENDTGESLRWPIAIAMTSRNAKGVSDWLQNAVKNKTFGSARQMLILALAKHVSRDVAIPLLYSVFEDLPGHVPEAMGLIGGANEHSFLRAKLEKLSGWQRKEAQKAMKKIERRLRRPRKPQE